MFNKHLIILILHVNVNVCISVCISVCIRLFAWYRVLSGDCHARAIGYSPSVIRYKKLHCIKWNKIKIILVILTLIEQTMTNWFNILVSNSNSDSKVLVKKKLEHRNILTAIHDQDWSVNLPSGSGQGRLLLDSFNNSFPFCF